VSLPTTTVRRGRLYKGESKEQRACKKYALNSEMRLTTSFYGNNYSGANVVMNVMQIK